MNNKRENLTIQRRTGQEFSTIASVPFETSIYETEIGTLDLRIYRPDSIGHQKVVFSGDLVPTKQTRGKKGQKRVSGKRRVVDFPKSGKTVSQDNGTLIFIRTELDARSMTED